jgi:hypothetical protein
MKYFAISDMPHGAASSTVEAVSIDYGMHIHSMGCFHSRQIQIVYEFRFVQHFIIYIYIPVLYQGAVTNKNCYGFTT